MYHDRVSNGHLDWSDGTIIGSFSTLIGQYLIHYLKKRTEKRREEPPREVLEIMLEDDRFEWRNLSTLQHVIGADRRRPNAFF